MSRFPEQCYQLSPLRHVKNIDLLVMETKKVKTSAWISFVDLHIINKLRDYKEIMIDNTHNEKP